MTLEAGLLTPDDWVASWISPAERDPLDRARAGARLPQAVRARGSGRTGAPVRQRRPAFTAWKLNGAVVGDHVLAPGWTSYRHRLRYETHDVADLLQDGANVLGAVVADGSWRGHPQVGDGTQRLRRASRPARTTRDQLRRRDHGGDRDRRRVDVPPRADSRRPTCTRARPIDARTRPTDGRSPAATTRNGRGRGVRARPSARWSLRRATGSAHEELSVRRCSRPRPGRTILDFGQNLVGRLRFRVQRAGRHDRHPPPRRGARARRARHAAAAQRRGDRPLHAPRRRQGDVGTASSPSTASATSRSTVGQASSIRPTFAGVVDALGPGAHRHVHLLERAAEPPARERRVGHARATSSTCRPTARNATNGSAGPATSRCSRPRPRSSTTSTASSAAGSPTSPPSRRDDGHRSDRRPRRP